MRVSYDNSYDIDSAPVATSEATGYPLTNTQDQRLTTRWRSTSTTAQSIVFQPEYGTQYNAAIAILGHNLTEDAVVTFELSQSDSWATPRYSTTLTVIEGAVVLKFVSSIPNMDGYDLLMETGDTLLMETGDAILLEEPVWAYARFEIDDADNPDGYVTVGRFHFGQYVDIEPSSLHDFTVTKKRSDVVTYGKGRQKYANPGTGWREFDLSFPPTKGTTVSAIQTMFDAVGNHTSFIFANFDSLRVSDGAQYEIVEPCYVSIDGDIRFRRSGKSGLRFEYGLTLVEDK